MSLPPPRRPRRSFPLAILASLLLHGLAFLWLMLRPTPPPPRPAQRPMELVLVEVPPARPPPAAPPSPAPPRPSAPATKPRPRAAPSAPVAAPLVPPSAPPEALASDVPRAAPTADAPSRGAAGGLVLMPRNPRLELPEQLPAGTRSPRGIPEAPRQRSAQELVSEVAEDVQGRSRAELGAFHPYFTQLGQALLAAWHPEVVVERSAAALQAQRKATLHDAVNAYRERAQAYGSTGSAFSGLDVGQPPPSNGPLDASAYTTGHVAMSAGMSEELKKKASALVRLVQDREGRLVALELVKASAHPEVDRRALEDLRAAGAKLPVPPPEALGLRNRLVSTWELAVHPVSDGASHSSRTFVASLVGLGWSKQVRLLSGL